MNENNKKVALITGANKGIGFETARQLAEQGYTVLIGARNEERGKAAEAKLRAENLDAHFVHLDVDDARTHETAAGFVEKNFGKLDVLVNNAGILIEAIDGSAAQASETSADDFRRTFDTNFFNTIAVTQKFVPLIKKSDDGRIVFLSSVLGSLSLHSDPSSPIYNFKLPAYDISKTALNGYAVHLAHELKDTPIKVNAAHPGTVATDMNQNGTMAVEDGAKTSVSLATLPPDAPSGRFVHLGEELAW